MKKLRPLAIYLPQFHPIPENDAWWGEGFTEWTNVKKAKPLFKGHHQPHVPAEYGYYDLRSPDVMKQQFRLASEHGIHGFMFYHYWFNGKVLLDTPIDNMFHDKEFTIPFCFCWANENWTRRWDGKDREILMEQKYSDADDLDHIRYLLRYFHDDRYIKVDGRPVLSVYRTNLMPDAATTASRWRSEVQKAGFPDIYLINVEAFEWGRDPATIGFDAAMEFQPRWDEALRLQRKPRSSERIARWLHRLRVLKQKPFIYRNHHVDYPVYMENHIQTSEYSQYKKYPCLMPSWDNASRRVRGGAMVFDNSDPETFGRWMKETLSKFTPYSNDENFFFINAWNEWAEGNHLEPCERWGRGNLLAVKQVLNGY